MIKVTKDVSKVPDSLQTPFKEFFPDGIPSPAKTTHDVRRKVVKKGAYIDSDRYKQRDTKDNLKEIYKNKCAYCEQIIEQFHVEHYRPKSIYYWLAFSWDNLLVACPTCNQYKDDHFELSGTKANLKITKQLIKQINSISYHYNASELPKMVNPEITDPSGKISFEKSGLIKSDNLEFEYTIRKCKIDRANLNDERRTLLDIFKRDIESILIEEKNIDDQKVAIKTLLRKFIRDSNDKCLPFLGFRRYAISADWLNEIIKEQSALAT